MKLLEYFARPTPPRLLVPQWRDLLGAEELTNARRAGLLVSCEAPAFYPCGGAHGDGCSRRVLAIEGSSTPAFDAVCGGGHGCATVRLGEEDRAALAVSVDGLVRQLRRALALGGTAVADEAGFPGTQRIGELGGRPAFLVLSPLMPGFEGWLGSRGEAVVLVPAARRVSAALRERFGSGQCVQLLPIGEQCLLTPRGLVRQQEGAPAPAVQGAAWCSIVDGEGARGATRAEYEALIARRRELDLFLDLTVTVDGGGHPGSMRTLEGAVVEVVLTKHEAAAIAELVTTRKALRAGDFRTVGATDRAKVVERARKKLDVPLSRYSWRSFHTLPADTPEAKRFQFNPPPLLRTRIVLHGRHRAGLEAIAVEA